MHRRQHKHCHAAAAHERPRHHRETRQEHRGVPFRARPVPEHRGPGQSVQHQLVSAGPHPLPGVRGALQDSFHEHERRAHAPKPHVLRWRQREAGRSARRTAARLLCAPLRRASGGFARWEARGASGHLEPATLLQRESQQPRGQRGRLYDPPRK